MVFGLFSPNSPGDDLLMPAQLLQQNDEFGIAMCNSKIKKKKKRKKNFVVQNVNNGKIEKSCSK